MTKREITSLVLKLMGVYILIRSLSYVPMTFSNFFTLSPQDSSERIGLLLLSALLSVIPLAFSLCIIIFSDRIAGWLIRTDQPVQTTASPHKDDVLLVVFTCIGLYLIVTAVPTLFVYFSQILRVRRADAYIGGYSNELLLISPLIQIGLGIWLFAGSSGVVKLWNKIRS